MSAAIEMLEALRWATTLRGWISDGSTHVQMRRESASQIATLLESQHAALTAAREQLAKHEKCVAECQQAEGENLSYYEALMEESERDRDAAREQRDEAHEALAIVESTLLAVTQVEELGKRGFSSEWVTLHEAVSAQTKHTLAEVRAVLSRAALRARIEKETKP